LGHTPKRIESRVSKRHWYTHVHSYPLLSSSLLNDQKIEGAQELSKSKDECKIGIHTHTHTRVCTHTHTRNIIQLQKRKKFWHMLWHKWTLRKLCKVILQKMINAIWFHLYEVSRVAKFIETKKQNNGWQGLRGKEMRS
jgi:hypothetical protein